MPQHQEGETVVLGIRQRYVETHDTDPENFIVYSPDTNRMKSSYDHYVLPKEDFEKALAAADDDDPQVSVLILKRANSVSHLSDPNLPQPEGGFNNVWYSCQVVLDE